MLQVRRLRRKIGKFIRGRPRVNEVTPEHVNLFDTFGFIKLEGYLKDEIHSIATEYDRMMHAKFGSLAKDRPYFFPQFADSSPVLTQLLENPKIVSLAAKLCGDNFVYKGSDANIFIEGSPWHRDYLLRTKSIKMLIYLEHNGLDSGPFCSIPGSHFVDDAFSRHLSTSLTWPEPPVLGGFDEKGRFPMGNNPKIIGQNETIPYVRTETRPGDVIVFNHNLVHCVNAPIVPKRRRLFGLHFCSNLLGTDLPEAQAEMDQIKRLALCEMRDFSLPTFYGPCVMNSTSPTILKHTQFLRDLHVEPKSKDLDGRYAFQSEESVAVGSRLKKDIHSLHRLLN